MTEFVADERFFALVKRVAEQADTDIPLMEDAPLRAVRRAYNDGQDIRALARTHSRYDKGRARIFPFFDDDEGIDEVAEVSGQESAVEEVVYQWTRLNQATSFGSFVQSWERLRDAVSSLATWHPDYDEDLGVIA